MPDVFTRHVRDLGTPKDRFEKFWKQFLRDLESEMRSRRLFNAAPPFLGAEYDEYATWHDPVAFEALATDCYMAAVLKRVKPLRDMLQQSSSVAGAVRKNIKYFLIDRQRKANPMGYKLFKNVEGILQEEIDQGRLAIEGTGDGKLRNETILLLDSEARPDPVHAADLRRLLDSSELWSDVVRVVAGPEDDARKPLVDALSELRAAGVGVLRLGDLLVALRERVRAIDRSVGRDLESGAGITRTILPDARYEEADDHQQRIRRIRAGIDRHPLRRQVKQRMHQLFDRLIALDESRGGVSWETVYNELRISRSTFWEYIKILRSIIKETEAE